MTDMSNIGETTLVITRKILIYKKGKIGAIIFEEETIIEQAITTEVAAIPHGKRDTITENMVPTHLANMDRMI